MVEKLIRWVEKLIWWVEKLIGWVEILKNELKNYLIGLGNNLCEVGILEVKDKKVEVGNYSLTIA